MKLLAVFLRVGCILSLTQALPVNFTVHTGSFIPVNGSVTVHAEIPVNSSGPIKGLCDFKKQNCSPRIGAQCPQCDASGNFLPVQCSGSTGYCWCVNVITGELVPNSTVPPGHMPPKCGETKDEDDSDSRSSKETKEEKDSDSSSSDESMKKPDKEEETKEEKDSHSSSSDKSKEQKEESDSSSSEETKEEKDSDSSSSDKSKKPKEESDSSSSEETKEEKDSDSSSSDESMKKPDKEEETKEEKDSHSSSSDKSQKDKDESDSSSSEETKEKKDSDSSSSDKSMKHQKESDRSSSEETKEDKDSVSSSSDKPMKHQDDSKSSSSEEDAGCPHDWTRFDQQCFVFIDSPKSWAEAESYCQFDGSNLASVHSYEENHFLQSLTRGNSHNFPQAWIGGTDTMHLGLWTWSDGSKFLYENWSDNSKDGDSHRCLKINYDYEFKWTAARCSESLPFVCSKNVEKEKEA